MASPSPAFRGVDEQRVVILRPGPSVVYDGSTVHATVCVELRTDDVTPLYAGTALSTAVDAACEELEAGDVTTIRDRAYFQRFWSSRRLTSAEESLRDAVYG